jgi:FlaA1/EpsC-like NDP-sugar epimerase
VRIADVARRLVEDCGCDVSIEFTGLRPGEKLHEVLFAAGERVERQVHDKIFHVPVPPLPVADIRRLDPTLGRDLLIEVCARTAVTISLARADEDHGLPTRGSAGARPHMRRASDVAVT